MKRLSEKNILVTGASRGIGKSIAQKLALEGARVAITYSSNAEKAQEVLKSLEGTGHIAIEMQINDEASVQAGFIKALEAFSELHGLVNNAGITRDQLLLRMKTEDFDQVIQTNLRGTFLCTKTAVKTMLKARYPGSIVNITSVIGHTGNPGQANYAASKAGIEALTKSIALEIASRQIRLNCVAPGFIASDMTEALNEEQKKTISDRIPLQKIGDGDDVASAVLFLLSSESKYITGQTIHVNGGLLM